MKSFRSWLVVYVLAVTSLVAPKSSHALDITIDLSVGAAKGGGIAQSGAFYQGFIGIDAMIVTNVSIPMKSASIPKQSGT